MVTPDSAVTLLAAGLGGRVLEERGVRKEGERYREGIRREIEREREGGDKEGKGVKVKRLKGMKVEGYRKREGDMEKRRGEMKTKSRMNMEEREDEKRGRKRGIWEGVDRS